MPGEGVHLAPGKMARIAGGFYLAFALASVLAGVLGHIGMGGAEQVYQSLIGSWREAGAITVQRHSRETGRQAAQEVLSSAVGRTVPSDGLG